MIFRFSFLLVGLLLAPWAHSAEHAIIRTRDGKTYEGEVKFAANRIFVARNGTTNEVPFAELSSYRWQPPSATNGVSATNVTPGVRAIYFNATNFLGAVANRIEPGLTFQWLAEAPAPGIGADRFSARFEGWLEAPATNEYNFLAQTDGTAKLVINHKTVIGDGANGLISLEGGQRYSVYGEYIHQSGPAFLKILWSYGTNLTTNIPTQYLTTRSLQTNPPSPQTITNGLLGLYFDSPDLTGAAKHRYDSQIDFEWGAGPPIEGLSPDKFSVRWVGRIIPPTTEHYTFHTVTDDGVRLWVDNKIIIDHWREELVNAAGFPILLNAGQLYDLRMEMFDNEGKSLARLFWTTPSIQRSIIPSSRLLPGEPAQSETREPAPGKIPAGILLTSGTLFAQNVTAADESSLRLSGRPETTLSTINVARIYAQDINPELLTKIPPGRAGVLLTDKNFAEGEFKAMDGNSIQLSSVLFGSTKYDRWKVAAVVLRDAKAVSRPFEVRTRNRSHFLVDQLNIGEGGIRLKDPVLNEMVIAAAEIVEIQVN